MCKHSSQRRRRNYLGRWVVGTALMKFTRWKSQKLSFFCCFRDFDCSCMLYLVKHQFQPTGALFNSVWWDPLPKGGCKCSRWIQSGKQQQWEMVVINVTMINSSWYIVCVIWHLRSNFEWQWKGGLHCHWTFGNVQISLKMSSTLQMQY